MVSGETGGCGGIPWSCFGRASRGDGGGADGRGAREGAREGGWGGRGGWGGGGVGTGGAQEQVDCHQTSMFYSVVALGQSTQSVPCCLKMHASTSQLVCANVAAIATTFDLCPAGRHLSSLRSLEVTMTMMGYIILVKP